MTAKINKALDYNKLLQDQAKGKLLKKHISYPFYAGIKFDGNYTVVIKQAHGVVIYLTSGGHEYTNDNTTIFESTDVPPGVYFAERIGRTGELGDRTSCALRGSKGSQVAYGHKFWVFDTITLSAYEMGKTRIPYHERRELVRDIFPNNWAINRPINTREELEDFLKAVTSLHWEGLMCISPTHIWKNTKSRTVDLFKYKKRPTVDLLVIGVEEGEGKYVGMIGALTLKDKKGRIVSVGSGMEDWERCVDPSEYIGRVVEVFYEHIGVNTYIQPTFGTEYDGILIRTDKTAEDID